MDADEVRYWSSQYDENHDSKTELIELHDLLSATGGEHWVTKEDLEAAVRWKLSNQGGRAERYIGMFVDVPDEYIRRLSEAAFSVDDPELQVRTLTAIPGIGPAISSAVLAFNDPVNRRVGDRYLMDELFGKETRVNADDYPRILDALIEENPGGFDLRKIEKAVWERYRQKNEIEW